MDYIKITTKNTKVPLKNTKNIFRGIFVFFKGKTVGVFLKFLGGKMLGHF